MDLALEDIFSPLRGDISLAESTHSVSSSGTPVLGQESIEKRLQRKLRVSENRGIFSETTVELDIPEAKLPGLKPKTGSASCPSIEEEEVFPKAEEKSESDSKKEEVTKRRSAKVKSSKREKARESRTPKGEDSGTKEEGRAAKGVEDSARREERRKSRNKEAEEHSLKNQMSSMEKSIRLGVSMELDSLRSLMYDQQAVLHKQLNRVLDECQRTQKTNAFLLSVIEKQNEMLSRLLPAVLPRNNGLR